jgi:3'(2'), 5'-bisphosphate nucleotidase
MTPLVRQLVEIAARAADLVLHSYHTTYELAFKGPNDPVTSADRAANDFICDALSRAFPGWPIVAEESDPKEFASFRDADSIFFVDPIDGTQEFVDRTDEFVVMIGLVTKRRAVAGVIHSPVSGLCWAGELGAGAYVFEAGATPKLIAPSRVTDLSKSSILVSRADCRDPVPSSLQTLGAAALRSLGSAGLKGAMVAEGRADAYVAPRQAGKRWDACALDALVCAAGGCVTDVAGRPIDYCGPSLANDQGMVVSNGALHSSILERLAAAARS